ncbi:hypothetical protein AB1Y20_013764 [Prymnesium parvum]|uniref:Membrane magnesium transporter n=1 Tax=Prymnesium parvum TaxID=97485 RepID=A0AB34IE61_PRYPA
MGHLSLKCQSEECTLRKVQLRGGGMAARIISLLLAALTGATAHLASSWPERPLGQLHARKLEATSLPPSDDDLAIFQIIACSSIALTIAFFFAIAAMFNMEYTNDSLLYSKSKSD